MSILICDDDKNIVELLSMYLENKDYKVLKAYDGSMALDVMEKEDVDLVLLDIMMPLINGYQVCEMIKRKKDIPVIMLTAKSTTDDKLEGFDAGADDYVTKPFDPKEVVARVKVQLRKNNKKKDSEYRVDGLTVNTKSFEVTVDGKEIKLKPLEIKLLCFFIENANIVFERDVLLDKVWGYDYMGNTRTVDVHIKRLRTRLGLDDNTYKWDIKTIWGVGYKFEVK